jgi:hypothetical protein
MAQFVELLPSKQEALSLTLVHPYLPTPPPKKREDLIHIMNEKP